ncbi:dolichyl-diphosphooligosaccharide-glycosyltransferase subunit dad1 [Raphidocelis subcapitata]|uniref:Dolichyl-diphosphooligosaccharide--protein glycosyltransferase subunit DAD1 n=1 Tax=Raphidocelis subcapitata TaxID=307507 RepID=A0A2V0NKZ1_9CHLO|nr:dolichyl-diphosphooligosaccharide-glycosyltransferase subunit dad1 [Raphidocelis subcapitata]|eukprot:GBF88031.1 dolichyl-diphosphooligosaccharide-glycosyltransferase subunit dad1 [Raphidocelis subcapitata]
MAEIGAILRTFADEYKKTPAKVKALDAFIVYALATAGVQFLYMLLVGTFPFNSFLAGILCSLAFFSLTVCLRMQIDPSNKDFSGISPERAFADYVLANAVLFLAVWNYMG